MWTPLDGVQQHLRRRAVHRDGFIGFQLGRGRALADRWTGEIIPSQLIVGFEFAAICWRQELRNARRVSH